ncbi:MAG: hypothetical protein V3U58_01645 [Thermodesulfobacteriota bacterium]
MKVYITTCCQKSEQKYGSTLIFKTIRVGFPTADITVYDTSTVQEARLEIARLAEKQDCKYVGLGFRTPLDAFIKAFVRGEYGTTILLDSDLCFWQSVEGWGFGDYLLAGRFIPEYQDEFTGCLILARLHTSFIWIHDVKLLRNKIEENSRKFLGFDPYINFTYKDANSDNWVFLDCGASLFSAFESEVFSFGEKELNSYDHLFCGSYADEVFPRLSVNARKIFQRHHRWAKNDYTKLKGIWKEQDKYFKRRVETTMKAKEETEKE